MSQYLPKCSQILTRCRRPKHDATRLRPSKTSRAPISQRIAGKSCDWWVVVVDKSVKKF